MTEPRKFIAARLPVSMLDNLEDFRRERSRVSGRRVSTRQIFEQALGDLLQRETHPVPTDTFRMAG